MKKIIYTIIFVLIWIFFFYEIHSVYSYLEANSSAVLTTPYNNLIISLRPELFKDFFYYRLYEINKISHVEFSNWIFALSPIIAAVIFYQLSFLFILLFARIREMENSFILFAIVITVQYNLFFDYITFHHGEIYYYFFTLLSNAAFIYMFFTLINRKLPYYIYFLSVILFGVITIHMYPASAYDEIVFLKILGTSHLITFILALGISIYDVIKPGFNYKIENKRVRIILIITSLAMIFIPGISYLIPIYYNINVSVFSNLIFYIPALFPMILMIFSLHNNYIFFNRPVRTLFLRLVYFIFFIFLYALIVGFEGLLVLSQHGNLWIHIASVFIFIIIFDALRLLSEITINYYINYRKYVFDEHITDIFQFMQTPFQFEDGIERFLRMIETGSGAGKVTLILSSDLFGGWLREKFNIRFVNEEDPIWEFSRKRFNFFKMNVISQGSNNISAVFLKKYSANLMIFFSRFKVALLLNEKVDGSPYLSEDLNYIKDLIRQTEPILENYKLLIDNIETKKFERELENVSQVQKKLKQPEIKNDKINVHMYNQPSKFVTGDYMEVFYLSKNRYLLLLGDVSGHSLASAYFMGMVRSMIDGLAKSNKFSLSEVLDSINSTLCDKQSASSFMTLCAIEIILAPKNKTIPVTLNYINAGQHSPAVYLKKSKKLIKLEDHQRVLGVINTKYEEKNKSFTEDIRLILTSDGAFEIFNTRGEILGEERFLEWINSGADQSPENLKDLIMKNIESYADDKTSLDDISILIVDINLHRD
ncbi:MAG: serine/threonine-protein phosphatase [Spirochaetia bacterium]|nr:serine/threonine-protein phosphatase [Spirochaetia bacterium]